MTRARALALLLLLGCSSSGEPATPQQPAPGSAGEASVAGANSAGAGGAAVTPTPTAGSTAVAGGGASSAGAATGLGGSSAGAGAGGEVPVAGSSQAGGGAGTAVFACSQVQGLTLTKEWYQAGFETGVMDAGWQLRAAQSAYVDEWANPNSSFWGTAATSPCGVSSASPERVVFVVLSWTIMAQADWEAAIGGAVQSTRAKYPNLRRLDLMTIIRGPANASCGDPNVYAENTHIPAALDAALAQVAAETPGVVKVAPAFAVDACSDFTGVGPHLTAAGNAKLAAKIAAWASVPGE